MIDWYLQTIQSFLTDIHWLFLVLALLISTTLFLVGEDRLVMGLSRLAMKIHVPAYTIGILIIPTGSSAPLFFFIVFAVYLNELGLVLGTIIGAVIITSSVIPAFTNIFTKIWISFRAYWFYQLLLLLIFLLLVLSSLPYSNPDEVNNTGGDLPDILGIVSFFLLLGFFWWEYRKILPGATASTRSPLQPDAIDNLLYRLNVTADPNFDLEEIEYEIAEYRNIYPAIVMLIVGLCFLFISSSVLVISYLEIAKRLDMNPVFVGATLAAIFFSLPDITGSWAAYRKGEIELAIGNFFGSSIFTILFGIGLVALMAPGTILLGNDFYEILFPTLVMLFLSSQIGLYFKKGLLRYGFGVITIAGYAFFLYTAISQ